MFEDFGTKKTLRDVQLLDLIDFGSSKNGKI